MVTEPDIPVRYSPRRKQAKLYWRVKQDGKWNWIAADILFEGGYSIMVNYLLEDEGE